MRIFIFKGFAAKMLGNIFVLLMPALFLTGCNHGIGSEKKIIGVYKGEITYREKDKDPIIVHNAKFKLTIFTDEIPTSTKYRAKIEVDSFVVVGAGNRWKNSPDLVFPEVTTEHNIFCKDGGYEFQPGETTADFGFPIPFLVRVEGSVDRSLKARIELEISASFGIGKEFVFEGKCLRCRSIPIKIKNLIFPLEKAAPIDVF